MATKFIKGGICIPEQTFAEMQALIESGKYRSKNHLMVTAIKAHLKSEAQNQNPPIAS